MAANHAAWRARRKTPAPAPVGSRPLNVREVLDLGNVVYFTFQGRAYGIPPLGWRAGQRLLLLWTEALSFPSPLTRESAPEYFKLIGQLPGLLWAHCHPTGKLRRFLRAVGCLRNPFKRATEAELVELAAFFLGRRSSSSIGLAPANPANPRPSPARPTFSTTSPTSATGSRLGSTNGVSP